MALENTAISRPREADTVPGYRLEKLVGKGGMGEVHRAVQLSLGRIVAVKLLAGELASDATFVARFEKEAAALAALSHPNIVAIVDKGKNANTYYLVMEFVGGASLREVMRSPQLDTSAALRTMVQICRAIEYAHGRGVIHRDLKPENILFDEQAGGIPKVSDFGLASFLDNAASKYNVTETHVSMGTLAYMAPEQRVDAKSADGRADIYSLGMMLYEMLIGELPVGTFNPPSRKKPGLDKRLDGIVARCLKPVPDDRYPDMHALLADLEPLAPQTFTKPPRKLTQLERLGAYLQRIFRRAVRIVSVAAVTLALIVLSVAFVRARSHVAPRGLPALEVMGELKGVTRAMTIAGHDSVHGNLHRLTLGEGPDTVPLLAYGRPVMLDKSGVLYAGGRDEAASGRVVLDLVDVDGIGASVTAELSAEPPPASVFASMKAVVLGTTLEPRATLLLVGEVGHYVGVSVGSHGEPLLLEWALGERRGAMLGPPSPPDGKVRLKLDVDGAGTLRASWLADREWRPLGEPLELGSDWHRLFEKAPTPGVGCVEGVCRARGLVFDVTRAPPPPPAPPPETIPAPIPPHLASSPPHAVEHKAPAKHPVAAAPAKKPPSHSNAPPKRHVVGR